MNNERRDAIERSLQDIMKEKDMKLNRAETIVMLTMRDYPDRSIARAEDIVEILKEAGADGEDTNIAKIERAILSLTHKGLIEPRIKH